MGKETEFGKVEPDMAADGAATAATEYFWQTVVVPYQMVGHIISPSNSADDDKQADVPAVQSEAGDTVSAKANRVGLLKWAALLALLLVALAVGGMVIKRPAAGVERHSISNGGFSYSFGFLDPVSAVRLDDGANALKNANNVVAEARPTTDAIPKACWQIGSKWVEAFSVIVQGRHQPVCSLGGYAYALYFSGYGRHHLFTLTYRSARVAANKQSLKVIFSSLQVFR